MRRRQLDVKNNFRKVDGFQADKRKPNGKNPLQK